MAQLPLITENRAQFDQSPGIPTPNVTMPTVQPVGLKAAADYQTTLANTLDRLSETLFGVSKTFAREAGLEYAAKNPMTAEQLKAMESGDPTKIIGSGPSINIFADTVRKARALEVSSYAEILARDEALKIVKDAELGKEVTSNDAIQRLNSLTDGYSQSLARVDPEASLKFRASLSTTARTVMSEVSKIETKRELVKRKVALDVDYNNMILEVEKLISNPMPIDPKTGVEFNMNEVTGSLQKRFINAALLTVGPDAAEEYGKRLATDIQKVKINVIAKGIMDKDSDIGGDVFGAIERFRGGVAGKYQGIYNSMSLQEQATLRTEIRKQYAEVTAAKKADQEFNKAMDEDEARVLTMNYLKKPNKADLDKLTAIAIRSGAVTPEFVADLPNKSLNAEPRNLGAEMKLKDEINNGIITDLSSLQRRARELGVGVRRTAELQDSVYKSDRSTTNQIEKIARQQARLLPGQMNATARQTESYYSFVDAVEKDYNKQLDEWDKGGKKGVAPNKIDVANSIVTKRRESNVQQKIDGSRNSLTENYGPNGKQKKSNIDFENVPLKYNSKGDAIDLSPDVVTALKRDKFTDAQIDDIRQRAIGIDRLERQRDSIR